MAKPTACRLCRLTSRGVNGKKPCSPPTTIFARGRRCRNKGNEELPFDPYAAENPGEFFAVMSEHFFETPEELNSAYPGLYGLLCRFYRQDPASR